MHLPMSGRIQIRIYGGATQPTLVYLPGLHGDWTLVGGFRRAVAGRVRFVEMTYPRTLTWSLEDYAAGVRAVLAEHGIPGGWLLGESFGSQVVWPMLAREDFAVDGVVLAGGFVQHPARWGVRLAEAVCGGVSLSLITRLLFGYARVARWRFRNEPEVLAGVEEFVARRTEEDRRAAVHRLRLIMSNNFCGIARQTRVPVYAITGLVDPIVPWIWVRRWLRRNCSALRDYRVVARADHTILASAPRVAAAWILQWMGA
jgi:pimeloyl-ACP methyl ester carboxylesterase